MKKAFVLIYIILLTFFIINCSSIYTESGNTNIDRNIKIKVIYGKVGVRISGHISENNYLTIQDSFGENKDRKINNIEMLAIPQGTETINQYIILSENNEFKYTLKRSEVIILSIRAIDENDAKIAVFEYGENKEYLIDGKNSIGRTISFKN